MEKYSIYLKKFQIAIGILVITLIIFIFLIIKIIPEVQKILKTQETYKTQSASLADAERKLQGLKDAEAKSKALSESVTKMFFKPITDGLDTEAAISDEFGEILQLIRDNKIKTRSIKYDYDPQDDNFVKNIPTRYHVCKISAEMIASYTDFANFLRELYKHEHFLEISQVEIIPYQKNKRILLINLQIKLYAQKDAATQAAEEAAAAAQQQAAANPDGQAAVPSPAPVDTTGGVSPEAAQ